MALSISEFSGVAGWSTVGVIPIVGLPALGTPQSIPIAGVSAQSAAFGAATRIIRIVPDVNCAIAVGPNPTAVATGTLIPASFVEYFAVSPGDKIAVIAA